MNVSENGDGNLTTPSNWSGGVFDSSPPPRGPNFTSTGNLIDTLAGNRTMTLSSGTATHGTLELGATGITVCDIAESMFAEDMDAEATGAVTQYQETLPEPTPGKRFYQVQDVTP